MVRRLLDAGANPDATLLSGETPVMVAARSGSPASVEELLAKGAHVNAHATRGQTALMWAVAPKHADAVNVLLAHDAHLHARSDGCSAEWRCRRISIHRAVPHGSDTALMFAARVGSRSPTC
jgi:ankyrin repeat protein